MLPALLHDSELAPRSLSTSRLCDSVAIQPPLTSLGMGRHRGKRAEPRVRFGSGSIHGDRFSCSKVRSRVGARPQTKMHWVPPRSGAPPIAAPAAPTKGIAAADARSGDGGLWIRLILSIDAGSGFGIMLLGYRPRVATCTATECAWRQSWPVAPCRQSTAVFDRSMVARRAVEATTLDPHLRGDDTRNLVIPAGLLRA
jgi:hypothetical protein